MDYTQAQQAIESVVPGVHCTFLKATEFSEGMSYEFHVTPNKGHVTLTPDTFFNKGKKLGLHTWGIKGATSSKKIVVYVTPVPKTELDIKYTNTSQILSIKVTIRN